MQDIPKEINVADFKCFIVVKDMMVAGVVSANEDIIDVVFLNGSAYPIGAAAGNSRDLVAQQVEEGVAFIVESYDEAMAYNVENAVGMEALDK